MNAQAVLFVKVTISVLSLQQAFRRQRSQLLSLVLVIGMGLLGGQHTALAGPTEWAASSGGNGHFYEFVAQTGLTWHEARDAAEASSFAGTEGHLATIGSAAEQQFLQTTFSSQSFLESWLGGWQEEGRPPEEGWHWVTGETWTYTNWAPGEPNDKGGDQRFLMMWGDQAATADHRWRWGDDHPDTDLSWNHGYFVEYPIPEPATLGALGLGIAALAGHLRRHRRRTTHG